MALTTLALDKRPDRRRARASNAREAHELGYNVALATDAMTDMSDEAHERSTKLIFARLGETGTTDELVALLDKHGA